VKQIKPLIALSLSVVCSLVFSVQAGAATTNGNCQEVRVPVSLSEGGASDQYIAGSFCTPTIWAAGSHQADVMVAGATYDRTYWDASLENNTYSYVDKTLAAGRATFAIDRIGSGKSSFPPSVAITNVSSAHTIHQAIQWVKNDRQIATVNLIGHSIGAALSIREAATYHDVNKLVVTATTHPFDIVNTLPALLGAHPAVLDPQFADSGYEVGYITSSNGTRADSFYNADVNPAVLTYDEAHKAVLSLTELTTTLLDVQTPAALNVSKGVTAPVLLVAGQNDKLYCQGLLNADCSTNQKVIDHEKPFYPNATSLDARIISNTGHALTMSPTHQQSFDAINNWLQY
jgi:pimeloyl-ACP methyl ester carboxylesterase